jgi:hypothetical protein
MIQPRTTRPSLPTSAITDELLAARGVPASVGWLGRGCEVSHSCGFLAAKGEA